MGANAHRGAPESVEPVAVRLDAALRGRFVRRYKRFFADVRTDDGDVLTVHCPNTGSMLGFHRPGAAVRCSTSDNPKRKLRHTLEMMRIGRIWVGLHTLRANALARCALRAGSLPALRGYRDLTAEVADGAGSRLDFRLGGHARGRPDAWVEVKSVTLAESGVALFPDSVTERGRRHLAALTERVASGERGALLFVVQRADCREVRPADRIDPDYGAALRSARAAGVEIYALSARVGAQRIRIEGQLPVRT